MVNMKWNETLTAQPHNQSIRSNIQIKTNHNFTALPAVTLENLTGKISFLHAVLCNLLNLHVFPPLTLSQYLMQTCSLLLIDKRKIHKNVYKDLDGTVPSCVFVCLVIWRLFQKKNHWQKMIYIYIYIYLYLVKVNRKSVYVLNFLHLF